MTAANQNPPTQKRLEFQTPQQLAAFALLENTIALIQTSMNQCHGFLGMDDAAQILLEAQAVVGKGRDHLLELWNRKVQLVGADALPKVH